MTRATEAECDYFRAVARAMLRVYGKESDYARELFEREARDVYDRRTGALREKGN